MTTSSPDPSTDKPGLHPRNRHRSRYDFAALIGSSPELAAFVAPGQPADASIDFADPAAVKALNKALLKLFYGIDNWDIPAGYLAPPIPGRADYVHYAADLLATSNTDGVVPTGKRVRVLDVGVGANCIYPIIGHREYGWRFVGSDVDPVAVRVAKQIIANNPGLPGAVDVRLQASGSDIFSGIIKASEVFDLTMCNPPFHGSQAEAEAANRRKTQNLGTAGRGQAPNFGGQSNELWYPGGEATFTWRMAEESALQRHNCLWFTTLISKKETLPGLYKTLQKLGAADVRTIGMSQGQKVSRIVAWTFQDAAAQQQWQQRRWHAGEPIAKP